MLSVHRKHDLIYSDVACLASIPQKNKKLLSGGDRESQWPEISYNSSEITYGKMLSF